MRQSGMELNVIIPNRIRSRGIEVDEALGWIDYDEFYDEVKNKVRRGHL